MIEMVTGSFNRRLDQALDRLDAGDDATRAAGINMSIANLQPLMTVAAMVRQVPPGVADPPVKTRVRNRFMAQAAGKRVAWVHRHTIPLAKARRRPQPRRNPIGSAATLILLAVLALAIGSVGAIAAGFSDPDSPLYPLKELGEGALSAITLDPLSKSDLEVTYAGQRLREAEAMASRSHPDLAVDAVRARYDSLRSAGAQLRSVTLRGPKFIAARDRFENEESQSVAAVEQALTNTGATDAAQEVHQLAASYDQERRVIDKDLVTPQAAPVAPTPAPKR